jgi:hypothetical protein
MQHPFEGLLPADHQDGVADGAEGRRSFLIRLFGSAAALCVGLLGSGNRATAQIYTTQAVGEEGGRPRRWPSQRRWRRSPPYGGWYRGPGYTTYMLGEEGGPVTTQALGEEGGPYTTQALGEEGGYYLRRRDD